MTARSAAPGLRPAPPPQPATEGRLPASDLEVAARAAGAEVRAAPGFMEINFPPPPAHAAQTGPAPVSAPAGAPPVLARTPAGAPPPASLARATGSMAPSPGGAGGGDQAVESVLRQLRLDNEHLGLLDGIDPLL